MNDTNAPDSDLLASTDVLDRLTQELGDLTPELRKAASYVLDNPNEVGVSSVRAIADAADVKPNTMVRMARSLGFEGYEGFREPFREDIRQGRESFQDRARWLQSLARGGKLNRLYAGMAEAALENIEGLYAGSDAGAVKAAADAIVAARHSYVLGVGVNNAYAEIFSYLSRMASVSMTTIPKAGATTLDGLVHGGPGDVLLAMTFRPFRTEIIEAVEVAHELGMEIIAVSDSLASPIMANAGHRFVLPIETPQFFPSTVALAAFLETLMAFAVADASPQVIDNIEAFHARRRALGVYQDGESP